MLPWTAGARPGKINMMSLPNSANSRLLPERKPSPTPTSSSNDPTPQAIPNMVRNERSLCAQRLRKICAKMSETVRIIGDRPPVRLYEELPPGVHYLRRLWLRKITEKSEDSCSEKGNSAAGLHSEGC